MALAALAVFALYLGWIVQPHVAPTRVVNHAGLPDAEIQEIVDAVDQDPERITAQVAGGRAQRLPPDSHATNDPALGGIAAAPDPPGGSNLAGTPSGCLEFQCHVSGGGRCA